MAIQSIQKLFLRHVFRFCWLLNTFSNLNETKTQTALNCWTVRLQASIVLWMVSCPRNIDEYYNMFSVYKICCTEEILNNSNSEVKYSSRQKNPTSFFSLEWLTNIISFTVFFLDWLRTAKFYYFSTRKRLIATDL